MTAPASSAGEPGFTAYNPVFDPPQPVQFPFTAPVISDGGAAGTFAAGTYQLTYTYTVSGIEYGMSVESNALTIAANHKITFGALANVSTLVSQLNVYVTTSNGSNVGLLGTIPVAAGATAATTFSAPPAGPAFVVPAQVISDTGEVFFPNPPATGTLSIQYRTFRFSDQQVTDALYDGLDLLWPDLWNYQPNDQTSVLPSPVQWEYPLPAQYADLRAVITQVEVRPPSAFLTFKRISGWRFMDDPVTPTLIFERPPPPGGTVRIRYVLPFTLLSDVPSIAQMLPVYYAVARLLADQEVMRSRADDLGALTAENAGQEKGGAQQVAQFWLQTMFAPALKKLSLGPPARRDIVNRVAERLSLSGIWQNMN